HAGHPLSAGAPIGKADLPLRGREALGFGCAHGVLMSLGRRGRASGEGMERVRRTIAVWLCVLGLLAAGIPGTPAQAQRPMRLQADELPVEEQPGVVPEP